MVRGARALGHRAGRQSCLLQGGGSLIVAIGAQNAYVIRTGVMKRHVFAVTTACFLIDAGLIWAGAAGLGTVIAGSAWLSRIAAWGGAGFLIVYGGRAAWAVWRPQPHDWDSGGGGEDPGWKGAVAAALGFSLLNPHVYLDTVVLIGSVAAQFEAAGRVSFAVGAAIASALWFYGIGYGAALAAPFFLTVTGARVLDACVWVIMWAVAGSLLAGVLGE